MVATIRYNRGVRFEAGAKIKSDPSPNRGFMLGTQQPSTAPVTLPSLGGWADRAAAIISKPLPKPKREGK